MGEVGEPDLLDGTYCPRRHHAKGQKRTPKNGQTVTAADEPTTLPKA